MQQVWRINELVRSLFVPKSREDWEKVKFWFSPESCPDQFWRVTYLTRLGFNFGGSPVRSNSLVLSHDPAPFIQPGGEHDQQPSVVYYLLILCSCFETQNKMKSPRLLFTNRSQLLVRWIAQINCKVMHPNTKTKMKRFMFEPTGSRKRVRFSTFSTLILTEPRTREEVNATWYTRRALAEFKRNGRMAVRVERKIAEILCRLIAQDRLDSSRQNPKTIWT